MHFHCCEDEVLVYIKIDSFVRVEIEIVIKDMAPEFRLSSRGFRLEDPRHERKNDSLQHFVHECDTWPSTPGDGQRILQACIRI